MTARTLEIAKKGWLMRQQGKDLTKIGKELGLSKGYAGQIVRSYELQLEYGRLGPSDAEFGFWMLYGVGV